MVFKYVLFDFLLISMNIDKLCYDLIIGFGILKRV